MFEDLLSNTVTVHRCALIDDGMGGDTESWTELKSGIAARIWKDAPKRTIEISGQQVEVDCRIAFKESEDILAKDVVVNNTGDIYVMLSVYRVQDKTAHHHSEGLLRLLEQLPT